MKILVCYYTCRRTYIFASPWVCSFTRVITRVNSSTSQKLYQIQYDYSNSRQVLKLSLLTRKTYEFLEGQWKHFQFQFFDSFVSHTKRWNWLECMSQSASVYSNNGRLDFTTTLPIYWFRIADWLMHFRQFHRFVWLTKLSEKWNWKLLYYIHWW